MAMEGALGKAMKNNKITILDNNDTIIFLVKENDRIGVHIGIGDKQLFIGDSTIERLTDSLIEVKSYIEDDLPKILHGKEYWKIAYLTENIEEDSIFFIRNRSELYTDKSVRNLIIKSDDSSEYHFPLEDGDLDRIIEILEEHSDH